MSLFENICCVLNTLCSIIVMWSIYDEKKRIKYVDSSYIGKNE